MSKNVSGRAEEIKHLSDEDIENLHIRYLQNEKIESLLAEFKVDVPKGRLIQILPPQKLDDMQCPYCSVAMYRRRKGKSIGQNNCHIVYCTECNHKIDTTIGDYVQHCCCAGCLEVQHQKKELANRGLRDEIREICCPSKIEPIAYQNIGLLQQIVLLAMIKVHEGEDYEIFAPLDQLSCSGKLAPTNYLDLKYLSILNEGRVILVDPESPLEAFGEMDGSIRFDHFRVSWIVNVTLDGMVRAGSAELYQRLYTDLTRGVKLYSTEIIRELMFEISCEEVVQYLTAQAEKFRFNGSSGDKTRAVINDLLQHFSVSQIYYFAYKSLSNANDYATRNRYISRLQAQNTVPNKMRDLGERALLESWNIKPFSRMREAPRSSVGMVFFDVLLASGNSDWAFNTVPGIYCEELKEVEHSAKCDVSDYVPGV